MFPVLARWVWVGALSSACGGSAPAGADGAVSDAAISDGALDAGRDAGPPRTPAERFLDEHEDAWCDYVVRCEQQHMYFDTRERECHPNIDGTDTARARRLLESGAIALDPSVAVDCLATLPALPCDGWSSLDARDLCRAAFVGTRAAGSPCSSGTPSECAPGHDCAGSSCVPIVGEGEPCETAVCDLDLACRDGSCAPLLGLGAPCEPSRLDCERWLACTDGICSERPPGAPEGSPCETGIECASDNACWGEPGVCTSSDGDRVGDVCFALRDIFVGDTCRGALVCRFEVGDLRVAVGRCVEGVIEGSPCDTSTPCAHGLRCVDATCVRARLPGESCDSSAMCPRSFACVDDVCAPLPVPAQRCTPDVGCLAGTCVGGICCLAPEWTPCEDDPSILGMCETQCFSDGMCGPPADCDPACAGQTCWREPAECVPRCPAP